MIKLDFDIHKIKNFGMGAVLGLAAGVLAVPLAAYHIISENNTKAAAKEAELTAENEALGDQIRMETADGAITRTLG